MKMENEFKFNKVSIRLVDDPPILSSIPINSPERAVMLVGNEIKNMDREVVAVINLKQDGKPINFNIASMGAVNYSVACPRELLKSSILSNAANIIVMHNHPSGSLAASKDDIYLTSNLEKICGMIGIPLKDHIIVAPGKETYYSFLEEGMIGNNVVREMTADRGKSR